MCSWWGGGASLQEYARHEDVERYVQLSRSREVPRLARPPSRGAQSHGVVNRRGADRPSAAQAGEHSRPVLRTQHTEAQVSLFLLGDILLSRCLSLQYFLYSRVRLF